MCATEIHVSTGFADDDRGKGKALHLFISVKDVHSGALSSIHSHIVRSITLVLQVMSSYDDVLGKVGAAFLFHFYWVLSAVDVGVVH